jgi:hypothetical protein
MDFLKTVAAIGGVMFFCLFFAAIGAVVYGTLVEPRRRQGLFEDDAYDWKDVE